LLVLISFGLVLVAIVLLVLGLIAGTGLTLIYASIGASLAAGVVLVVAKVAGGSADEAPAPSVPRRPAQEPEPVGVGATTPLRTSSPSPTDTTAPVPVAAQEPAYVPARQPAMAGAVAGGGAGAVMAGGGAAEDDEDDMFPIEDYDRLKVSEIVPLLPELYDDELDMVEERERAGKGRVSILNRIAELREEPLEDAGPLEGAEPEPVAVTDDTEVDDDFFPIEDYDELNVGEILPLLPELYDDELDLVEDRERATKNRQAIVERIAELREEPIGEAEPEPEPQPEVVTVTDDTDVDDDDFFPIEDYDELNVGEILPLLPELYDDELDVVAEHERATKNRAVVLNRLAELREERLAEAEPEPVAVTDDTDIDDEDFFPIEDYDDLSVGEILPLLPELYDDELDVVAERERTTKNRAAILNRLAELREGPLEEEEPEPVAVTDDTDVDDDDFFPIEDYDELNVGEIVPLLPELYDDELDVVEEHERATKNRAVVLDRLAELREEPLEEAEPEPVPVAPVAPEAVVEDEFFPIEDYDELMVSEILPLLAELYDDELDVVEDRERSTKNRAAILDRLAELREEPEPEPVDDLDEDVPEEPTPAFLIADYDRLRVPDIRALLPQLSEDELEQVRRREEEGRNRSTVLAAIDRKLGVTPPVPARKGTAKKVVAKKTAAKRAPAKKTAAKKTGGAVKRTAAPTTATAARGTAGRKAMAEKAPAAKRGAVKKTTTKKAPAKKAPAKNTAVKKAPAKKTAAKKAPAKTAPAKKAPAKKAPAKNTAVKRTAAPTKKTAARGTAAKKATAKKATRRR
jgi:hypothetical protein